MDRKVFLSWFLIFLAIVGIMDAAYLTYEHFLDVLPPCTVSAFADCGKVLQSQYAVIFGVPLSLLGVFHYVATFISVLMSIFGKNRLWRRILFFFTAVGLLVSLLLVYLQIFVIGAICQYCMVSAIDSILLYIFARVRFKKEYVDFFHMKRAAMIVFLVRPLKAFFSDKKEKHHTHKNKKHHLPTGSKDVFTRFILRYMPKHMVEEFLEEYKSRKH